MAKQILPGDVNPYDAPLKKFVDFHNDASGASSRTIRYMALALERAIKLMLSHPGSGIEYRRSGGRKGKHRASAPGEPPAPDTGRLRRSIGFGIVGGKMRVGSAGYAKVPTALEFGTTTAGKNHNITILPRPFMRPAWKQVEGTLGGVVQSSLQSELRGFKGSE